MTKFQTILCLVFCRIVLCFFMRSDLLFSLRSRGRICENKTSGYPVSIVILRYPASGNADNFFPALAPVAAESSHT